MFLSELKAQARNILAIPESQGNFTARSFKTGSGSLRNTVGVVALHEACDFAYNTSANGKAYRRELVVMCKDTGAQDKKGRVIHLTPDNLTFVYSYYGGSASRFDSGELISPEL